MKREDTMRRPKRLAVAARTGCLLACWMIAAGPGWSQQPEPSPARTLPTVDFEPGPEYADQVRMFQGIPGLERAANGRLWATWYGGGVTEDRYNYVMLVTSGDDGATWSDLKLVIDPDGPGPVRAFDPCLWIDPDGKLWLFWCQATRGGGGDPFTLAITTENPESENPEWSEPQFIHDGVMMNKPTVLADGTWLLPTAIWRREASCRVVASTDQGRTWELRGTASVPDPEDRNCDEPMLVERQDGSVWQLVRTRYGIGESTSNDRGRTWTPVTPWNVPHPAARFFIRRLDSEKLLLVKHGPLDERTGRSHLTAFLSDDDGKSWQGGLVLDERNGVSYPDGVQAEDGTITIIYDFDRSGEKYIYLAVFTEQDILAGECVSDSARLRVVVNKAEGLNPRRSPRPAPVKIEFDANEDGQPLLTGEAASLEPADGDILSVEQGAVIFSNRPYKWHAVPEPLAGKRFIQAPIDGLRVTVRDAGVVFVITPTKGRNRDSLADPLIEQGFSKAKLPEFLLFTEANAPGNVCTTYQKVLEAGETIELGKWSVVIF
jgi:predicted neuraminidase